ncbi:MAG TPA: hypothetical protein VLA89_19600 [Gemmatimonadales bacterium]|nr:hypothetical protein [Gemmatimonadales bacterium]
MPEFDPIEALEELAEELVLEGEGSPSEAGVTCPFCENDITRPWELREQLPGVFDEHLQAVHGTTLEELEYEDESEGDEEA